MAEQKTQLLIDENHSMQTDPALLSGDEDTKTEYYMSDRDLTNDYDDRCLNQVQIHPKDPTDVTKVTISGVDVDVPTLSHSAATDSQQDKNIHNVSPISDDFFLQPKPHPIELQQLPTEGSQDSPTPSNKGRTHIFKPYDLPNTPPLYNDPEQRQINAVAQALKQLALHTLRSIQKNLRLYSVRQTI